jgi:hypothetical protein
MHCFTTETLYDPLAIVTALRASAATITTTRIPIVQARSDRLSSSVATQQTVYAAGVDDAIGKLLCQQNKVGAAMQRGMVACGKRVDADVDAAVVSGEQLKSVGKLCEHWEATPASHSDSVQVLETAYAVCEYGTVDATLQIPVWSESYSGMRDVLLAVEKVPLTQSDVNKEACVVRGQGVERYVPSSEKRHGDEHNKMQLVCVSSGGVPVPYLSASHVDLDCVGDGSCFGECVAREVVGPGVIEMTYRVEGTGDLQLAVRVLGEAVLVSVLK